MAYIGGVLTYTRTYERREEEEGRLLFIAIVLIYANRNGKGAAICARIHLSFSEMGDGCTAAVIYLTFQSVGGWECNSS